MNPYHISAQQPAELEAKDFDHNGVMDDIFCYYIKNDEGKYVLLPGVSRDDVARQMPSIKKTFPQNSDYAKATMNQIINKDMMMLP